MKTDHASRTFHGQRLARHGQRLALHGQRLVVTTDGWHRSREANDPGRAYATPSETWMAPSETRMAPKNTFQEQQPEVRRRPVNARSKSNNMRRLFPNASQERSLPPRDVGGRDHQKNASTLSNGSSGSLTTAANWIPWRSSRKAFRGTPAIGMAHLPDVGAGGPDEIQIYPLQIL